MLGEGEQRSFMVVYVDGILIFSPSFDLVKEVMLKLQDKFKCKALGDVSFYLRLLIERDVEKRCMRVHQRKYLEALAANFGQSEGHVATPFPSGFKCVKGLEEESVGEEERRRFHSLVGSLMYVAVNTQPDVAFATGQLARVVQCPNEEQVAAGMRVAKYLGQTPTVLLTFAAERRSGCERRRSGKCVNLGLPFPHRCTGSAARGTPRTPFFEGCSPSPLAPSYASAVAADVLGAEDVKAASASGKRSSSKGKVGRGGGGGDSVSLFDHTPGASLAPPATADSATRSQWLTWVFPSPLAPSYASDAAVDILGVTDVGAASALRGKRRSGKGKGGRSGGGGSGGGDGGGSGVVGGSGGGGSGGSGGGSGGFGGGGGGSGGSGGSGSSRSGGTRGGAFQRGGSGGGQRQQQQ
ncbi:unnamed protein product [Closterium sp. NIES-54]